MGTGSFPFSENQFERAPDCGSVLSPSRTTVHYSRSRESCPPPLRRTQTPYSVRRSFSTLSWILAMLVPWTRKPKIR